MGSRPQDEGGSEALRPQVAQARSHNPQFRAIVAWEGGPQSEAALDRIQTGEPLPAAPLARKSILKAASRSSGVQQLVPCILSRAGMGGPRKPERKVVGRECCGRQEGIGLREVHFSA